MNPIVYNHRQDSMLHALSHCGVAMRSGGLLEAMHGGELTKSS